MKNFLSLFAAVIISLSARAEEMPVLKVTFPTNQLTDEYVQGEMTLTDSEGTTVKLPARMKTRGATAKQYTMKPSFNMKLEDAEGEEYDTDLLGLRKASSFILDAMAIDRICMRNRVCFDIWNKLYRLPYDTDFDRRDGTVGKFVEVYLNNEYKGIYCLTDKINRKLLDLKKPQVDDDGSVTIRGVLYKNGTNDIADQNTPGFFNDSIVYIPRWHDAWELHEPEDYPGLATWAPLMQYYADGNLDSYNYITNNFEEENLIDYTLFIMVLSIADNWGYKNKYFSIQNIEGKGEKKWFIVTPWDLDTSLGGHYNGNYYDGNYSNWTPADVMKSANSPFSAVLANNSFKEKLRDKWIQTRSGCFAVDSVAALMYGYCEYFESTGAWEKQCNYWDSKSNKPKYVTDLRGEIGKIVEWYKKRHAEIDKYFEVDDISTDLRETSVNTPDFNEGEIYDLRGMRVTPQHLRKGEIYIQNGRKFLVR